ncbi:GumC family protein [uncultured Roseobacter sp.]|uniref:GumC family protein n=1 Tax=uncultured Roseobacter sp. TaxID=114847 RepID=UPI00262734A4|nr:GumC family protein [uncultured Roseobacter sp.]
MTKPVQERRITWTKDNAHLLAGYRDEPRVDMGSILRAMRRQAPLAIICALAGIVIAVLMILGSLPRYTAVETVLLDEERAELLNEVSPLPNAVWSDTAVQSEIEIIKSRALAYQVVDLLNLDEDADFLSPPVGATQRVLGLVSLVTDPLARLLTPAPPAPSASGSDESESGGGTAVELDFNLDVTDRDRAVQILRDRLSVSRSGRSLVIEIGFADFEPRRAAMIARGYGWSYEGFQLVTTNEIAAKAEGWLRERLDRLEQKSMEAAAAVQEFRATNDLVEVRGNLLTEQQQSELASALMNASANAAEAEAQLESMESLLARSREGEEIITVPFVEGQFGAGNEALRRDYLDGRLRYRRLVTQFGPDHPQAQQLKGSLDLLREAIEVELEQATEAARVSYLMSRSREESLRADLEAITGSSDTAVALRGRLQQLEAISETYAQVYRDYLARLEVATQQQNFPIAAIKIISPAEVPKSASSPQKKAMLFAGMLLGGMLGVLIGAARELLPKPIRTVSTLRQELGLSCVGLLPGRKSLDDRGAAAARSRTLERLAQACEVNLKSPGGLLVGIAPLSSGLEDPTALPVALAAHLSRNGARRVLVIHEDPAHAPASSESKDGIETVSLPAVLDSWSDTKSVVGGQGFDFGLLAKHLRDEFSFVIVALRPISEASRSDPHAWAYDTTLLRIPWGQVLPGFLTDALLDHPRFRDSLATTVLEDAQLATARRYMNRGSYEELAINA